ncbi:MAG: hypothetical protein ACKOAR_13210 [Bacteroidota bacterium]
MKKIPRQNSFDGGSLPVVQEQLRPIRSRRPDNKRTRVYLNRSITILLSMNLFLLIGPATAQSPQQPAFPSPSAAAIGKFTDIPVDLFSGVTQTRIPLTEVREGPLTIGVSLQYHSSGIRVGEVAGWTGLGWSLHAGGMIARTVNGGPDEGINTGTMAGARSTLVRSGWYKDRGYPQELNACESRPLSTEGPVAGTYPDYGGCASLYYEAAKGYIDTEPDLFIINLPGYHGRFFFDKNRQPHMIPESDLYIEPVNTPGFFFSWKVITPNGNRYYFGGSGATETSWSDYREQSGNKQVASSTTWYLTRIETPNAERWIEFDYADDRFSFGNRAGHQVTFREAGVILPDQTGYPAGELIGNPIQAPLLPYATAVDGKRLIRIRTSSGQTTIDFIPAAAPRTDVSHHGDTGPDINSPNMTSAALQTVRVNTGSICRNFELSYDYYTALPCTGCVISSDFDTRRLRLRSVQERSCSGESLPPYRFTYQSDQLPRRYSLGRDWLEFYNGRDDQQGLLPAFTNPVTGTAVSTAVDRSFNEEKMKQGILTAVTWPAGGSVTFAYEANRIGQAITGGLRIKSVITGDGSSGSQARDFSYSDGVLHYDHASYLLQYPNRNGRFTGAVLGASDFGITMGSNPNPPLWSFHGYHVGYGNVSTAVSGAGSTERSFLNDAPAYFNHPADQFPHKPLVSSVRTGKEASGVLRRSDGTAVESTESTYGLTGSGIFNVRARKVLPVSCLNCMTGSTAQQVRTEFGLWTDYDIQTHRFNPVRTAISRDGVSTSTALKYNERHNNPISATITDGDGRIRRSEFTYAGDAGSGAPASMNDPVTSGSAYRHMIGHLLRKRDLTDGVVTAATELTYSEQQGKVVLTRERDFPNGQQEFRETTYQYDAAQEPSVFFPQDGIPVSVLWGQSSQSPVAIIRNAVLQKTENRKSTSFSGSATTNSTSCVAMSGSITLTQAQTVTFSPLVALPFSGVWLRLTMRDGNGATVFGPKTYSAAGTVSESVSLQPGTYSFCLESGGFTRSGTATISFSVAWYSGWRSTLFHSSFEADGVANVKARSGQRVWRGTYSIPAPHVPGSYVLSWWQRPETATSTWVYNEQPVTITTATQPEITIGQSGQLIDEVRLHPVGAVMSTVTPDDGFGASSSTDPRQLTTRFESDAFGRLNVVRDDRSNIIRQLLYKLKIQ